MGEEDSTAAKTSLNGKGATRSAPADGKEERADAAKRPRRGDGDAVGRGRRMLGLLNSTLSQAREDNLRRSSGEAARKRAEIEARTQERLKAEESSIKMHTELTEKLKGQLQKAYTIAMDYHSTESMMRIRKAQKRRLASFMVTESHSARFDGEQAKKVAVDERIIGVEIAACIAPLPPRPLPDPPVYYLPKRMLPKQDDMLDDQEDRVDDALDEADQAWEKQKSIIRDDLEALKGVIREIRDELNGLQRGKRASATPSAKDGKDMED